MVVEMELIHNVVGQVLARFKEHLSEVTGVPQTHPKQEAEVPQAHSKPAGPPQAQYKPASVKQSRPKQVSVQQAHLKHASVPLKHSKPEAVLLKALLSNTSGFHPSKFADVTTDWEVIETNLQELYSSLHSPIADQQGVPQQTVRYPAWPSILAVTDNGKVTDSLTLMDELLFQIRAIQDTDCSFTVHDLDHIGDTVRFFMLLFKNSPESDPGFQRAPRSFIASWLQPYHRHLMYILKPGLEVGDNFTTKGEGPPYCILEMQAHPVQHSWSIGGVN